MGFHHTCRSLTSTAVTVAALEVLLFSLAMVTQDCFNAQEMGTTCTPTTITLCRVQVSPRIGSSHLPMTPVRCTQSLLLALPYFTPTPPTGPRCLGWRGQNHPPLSPRPVLHCWFCSLEGAFQSSPSPTLWDTWDRHPTHRHHHHLQHEFKQRFPICFQWPGRDREHPEWQCEHHQLQSPSENCILYADTAVLSVSPRRILWPLWKLLHPASRPDEEICWGSVSLQDPWALGCCGHEQYRRPIFKLGACQLSHSGHCSHSATSTHTV